MGGQACLEGWKGFGEGMCIHPWQELDPVVHVNGASAVVAYDDTITFERGGRLGIRSPPTLDDGDLKLLVSLGLGKG